MEIISRLKWYIIGVVAVGVLFIISQMYLANQERKTAEQNQKIIQWQSQNPKVVYRSKKEIVYVKSTDTKKDVELDIKADKIEKQPDGTVIATGNVSLKEKDKTKIDVDEKKDETIKTDETKTPVYTVIEPTRIYAGCITSTKLDYAGAQVGVATGQFLFTGAYTTKQEGIISASIKVLEFR
jgi:hypothetical protein